MRGVLGASRSRGRRLGTSVAAVSSSSKSLSRRIAEEMAGKRRAGEQARLAAGGGEENAGGSLAGVAAAGAVLMLGGLAVLARSEAGEAWLKATFKNTPVETALNSVQNALGEQVRDYTAPVTDLLLPDLLPEQRAMRTLVLDCEDVVMHLEWDRRKGWRAVKRPGVDALLSYAYRSNYEVVLFSSGNRTFLEEYVVRLDPNGIMNYRLFRESTVYENGEHVKDLSHLNRDLGRVVAIGSSLKAFPKHESNTIVIPPYTDIRQKDTALVDLLPLLEEFFMRDVKDVRKEIRQLRGDRADANIVQEFKEFKESRLKKTTEERKGTLGGFLGKRVVASPAATQQLAAPMVPDIVVPMTKIEDAASLKALPATSPAVQEPKQAKAQQSTIWSAVVGK